jgi:hypothetical protein
MRKIMTPGRSASFALAIASIAGAAPGVAQDAPKFDCARLAPLVQRQAREMSTLLPDIENTDVQTTLKGKASGELAHTIIAYSQARQALIKPLRDYRDSLEELAHLLQRWDGRKVAVRTDRAVGQRFARVVDFSCEQFGTAFISRRV